MTLTDPIGDMFSRIRNGQMRSLNSVDIPSSNFRQNILKILKNEGFIKDYYIEKTENKFCFIIGISNLDERDKLNFSKEISFWSPWRWISK